MTDRVKKTDDDGPRVAPEPTPRKPLKVVPGAERPEPLKRRPPKIRVVKADEGEAEERLTPTELKERFARNLDGLLSVVGLSRKDAAAEIGVPYKLVRRLASAGVSFAEDRNSESLTRIADYFALPSVDHLWRGDLVRRLLATEEGEGFLKKFRDRLLAERERRVAEAQVVGQDEVALMGRALGVLDADVPPLAGAEADKVATILASPKADTFRRIIDDYYALAKPPTTSPEEERATKRPVARA